MKPERQQVGVIREENRVLRAEEILLMSNRYPKAGAGEFPYSSVPDYYDRLRDVTACQQEALFRFKDQTVDLNGTPEKVVGMIATPSLLQLLQVPPVVGRTFTDDEGEIGAESGK